MPRAAPGVHAWGAVRRIIPGNPSVSVHVLGRYRLGSSSRVGMDPGFRPDMHRFHKSFYFTLHLSGFGVERGRLGEVESLVGDCRPPPPGNPRQPTILKVNRLSDGGLRENPIKTTVGFYGFIPNWQKNGGVFLPKCKLPSLNIIHKSRNLKKLIPAQYFKNKYSFFTCTELPSVLECCQLHCHLYGVWLVEPPSIAITNVLGKRDCHYALPVL